MKKRKTTSTGSAVAGVVCAISILGALGVGVVCSSENKKLKLENEDLIQTNITITLENEELKNDNITFNTTINGLNTKIDTLNARIEELEKELAEYKSQVPTSVNLFTFKGNTLISYIGEETDIVIPSSYSLGEPIYTENTFEDRNALSQYLEGSKYVNLVKTTLSDGSEIAINSKDDFNNYKYDIDFPCVAQVTTPTYVEGKDYEITEIGTGAFRSSNLTSVDLSNTKISKIQAYAFSGLHQLTTVKLNDCLQILEEHAFYSCRALTSIKLPESVTSLGNAVFSNCLALITIDIPVSITTLPNSTFAQCNSLTTVNYGGTIEQWQAIEKGVINDILTTAKIVCIDGVINDTTTE